MAKSSWPAAGWLAAALLACASPTIAATPPPSARELEKIRETVVAKQWQDAKTICDKALREVVASANKRSDGPARLADFLTRCAHAYLRGGDSARASWLWYEAQFMDSDVARDTADWLEGGGDLPAPRQRSGVSRNADGTAVESVVHTLDGGRFDGEPPTEQSAPRPQLTISNYREQKIVVEVVVGTDGRPREPRLVAAENVWAAQGLAVLESVRAWQFTPATENGAPVEVLYDATVTAQRR